jgi:hypothetical protein
MCIMVPCTAAVAGVAPDPAVQELKEEWANLSDEARQPFIDKYHHYMADRAAKEEAYKGQVRAGAVLAPHTANSSARLG